MFGNGMLLAEFKEELMKKFGYSEELAEDIVMVAQDLEEQLGTEYLSVILDAIRTTKVVSVDKYKKSGVRETVLDVLDREGMTLSNVVKHPSGIDVRNLEGTYAAEPTIIKTSDGYELARDEQGKTMVKKLAVINMQYVPGGVSFLAELTREFTTAITSHLNAHSIEEDKLITRRGLCVSVDKISKNGDSIERKNIECRGYGLEEGLSGYNKLAVTRECHDDKFDLQSHSLSILAAGVISDMLKLKDIIFAAQVTKDESELRRVIDEHYSGGYDTFLDNLDVLYDLEKRCAELSTGDKHVAMEAIDALENYYRDTVTSMLREVRISMKIGLSDEEMTMNNENSI